MERLFIFQRKCWIPIFWKAFNVKRLFISSRNVGIQHCLGIFQREALVYVPQILTTQRYPAGMPARIFQFLLHNVIRLAGRPGFSDSYYTTSALGLAPRPLGLGPLVDMIKVPLSLLFSNYHCCRIARSARFYKHLCDVLELIAFGLIPVTSISIIIILF